MLDHSEIHLLFLQSQLGSQDCLHERLFAIVVFACDGNVHKPQQRVSMASK